MNKKNEPGATPWVDPDDAPELDAAFFAEADVYEGDRLVRRGRPPSDVRKQLVSLRLDRDVIEKFRSTGPGWQTRINQALRDANPEA